MMAMSEPLPIVFVTAAIVPSPAQRRTVRAPFASKLINYEEVCDGLDPPTVAKDARK